MTIIHVIPNLKSGGAEHFLAKLSSRLKDSIKQIIFTFENPSNDFLFPKIDQKIECIHNKKELLKRIKADKNTKIICWMYPSIFYIEKLFFFNQINSKIVWNIRHSNFTKYQIRQKIGLLILGLISRLKKTDIIYCASAAKKYHESYLFSKKHSIVILNGLIREIPFDNKSYKESPYFLYVGRYNFSKGPDILLRVFNEFSKTNKNFKLKIVGSGWNKNHIPQKIRDEVELMGNQDDLSQIYSKASAFLFTSRTEGYPNVLAEACSFGLPIVSTNAGDANIILKEYPYGQIVSSEKEFLIKLKELNYPDFAKREGVGKAFRKKNRFSNTTENYLEFLKEI